MGRYFAKTTILIIVLMPLLLSIPSAAYAQSPNQDADVMQLLKAGADHVYGNRYEEAIEPLKKALSTKPDPAKEMAAHYLLGLAYTGLKRYDDAIEAFKHAISIKPDFTNAHLGLGKVYFSTERYEEAIDAYKHVIAIEPNYANGHFSLGMAYIGFKHYQDAVEPLKKAIGIKSDFVEARYYLGLVYAQLGDKNSALKECEALKSIDKKSADQLQNEIEKIQSASSAPASTSADKSGKIRVGVVTVKNKSSQSVSTSTLWAYLMRRINNTYIQAVPIEANAPEKIETEAGQKGCGYILYTDVISFLDERPITDTPGNALGTPETEIRINFRLFHMGSSSPQLQSTILGREDRRGRKEEEVGLETIEKEVKAVVDEILKNRGQESGVRNQR